jgi:hypothetical protein
VEPRPAHRQGHRHADPRGRPLRSEHESDHRVLPVGPSPTARTKLKRRPRPRVLAVAGLCVLTPSMFYIYDSNKLNPCSLWSSMS